MDERGVDHADDAGKGSSRGRSSSSRKRHRSTSTSRNRSQSVASPSQHKKRDHDRKRSKHSSSKSRRRDGKTSKHTSRRKDKKSSSSSSSKRRSRSRSRSASSCGSASVSDASHRRRHHKRDRKHKKHKHKRHREKARDGQRSRSSSSSSNDSASGRGDRRGADDVRSTDWAVSCVVEFLQEKPVDRAATLSLVTNLAEGNAVDAQAIANQGLKVLLKQLVLSAGCSPAKDGSRTMHAPDATARATMTRVRDTLVAAFPDVTYATPSSASTQPARGRGVSGPQVPIPQRLKTASHRDVAGDDDDSESDDNGPQALGAPGQRQASFGAVAMSVEQRKRSLAKRGKSGPTAKAPADGEQGQAREDWMLVPPDEKKNEMRLEMTSRGFEGMKRAPKDPKAAREAWTATPGDEDKALETDGATDAIMGPCLGPGGDAPGIRQADDAVRLKLEAFNKEHRSESLMNQHARISAKVKKKKDEAKAAAAAASGGLVAAGPAFTWDRERDMSVGAVDTSYANKVMSEKNGLSSRFARGNFR